MKFAGAILAFIALTCIFAGGCAQSQSTDDFKSTGLKPTPHLSQAQVQAAWEKKHPGEQAPQ